MDGWRRCQITKNQTEGVIGPDLVVTVGDDEEDGKFTNPPAKEAEQLERRAVSPVGVFADDDRWSRSGGESREHLPKEPIPGIALKGVLVNLYAEGRRQVAHRTERTGRGERVARGPQHRRRPDVLTAELLDQRGLANPGFAANQHHTPLPRGGVAEQLGEVIEVLDALE